MCNINHTKFPFSYTKFPCRICVKMFMIMIKLFSMTSVNFGFISNVTILIIQTANIYKTVMNSGIAWNVAAQVFRLTLVVPVLIVTTYSGKTQELIIKQLIILIKPSPNLELLLKQFNNTTPENSNDPENISTSEYYDYPCSKKIDVLLGSVH